MATVLGHPVAHLELHAHGVLLVAVVQRRQGAIGHAGGHGFVAIALPVTHSGTLGQALHPHADVLVVGATLDDGRELLAAVPTDLAGVKAERGIPLVALSASCTDRVEFDSVEITPDVLLAGPVENVMSTGIGGTTGGLQTSTLAVGLSRAAIEFIGEEASRREALEEPFAELRREVDELQADLLKAVEGLPGCDAGDIRGRSNRLVLRSTQAALTAAKGAGYVEGHPVGRWCQQALFFLVWSCPQPVAQAHLCELAGVN